MVESVSILSLVVIAAINVAKVSFVSAAAVLEGPAIDLFEVLEWIEIVLLLTAPGVLAVLAFVALVNQIFRFVMSIYGWVLKMLQQINDWRTGRVRYHCAATKTY